MKALSTLKSAINQSSFFGVIALVVLGPIIFPTLALAAEQTPDQQAPFEIKITDPSVLTQAQSPDSNNIQNSITLNTITAADPLASDLDAYLASKNSPLAGMGAQLMTYPYWKRALGISLVESNFCQYTPKVKTKHGWVESYNCSGMETADGNYQIFAGYMDWFAGINNLLGQPNYVNRPLNKFLGYYVVPGSKSWLYGVQKTESELTVLADQATVQRQALAQAQVDQVNTATALLTFAGGTN